MHPSPIPTLTTNQIAVVEALASGQSVSAAARAANVSRQTIYTWVRTHSTFQAALEQAQQDFTLALRDRMQALAAKALDRLEAVLDNPKAAPGIHLRASLAILARPAGLAKSWHLPNPFACVPDVPAPDLTKLDTNSSVNPGPQPPAPPIARKAPCPCGSGKIYKRCCGHAAPPLLFHVAAPHVT